MSDLHETDILIRIKEAFHDGVAWTALTASNIYSLGVFYSSIRSEFHRTSSNDLYMNDGTKLEPIQNFRFAMIGEDYSQMIDEDFTPAYKE